ncbi:hypothetical protein VTH82DRAFT_8420 [Thermothelomyces myriococcoides]
MVRAKPSRDVSVPGLYAVPMRFWTPRSAQLRCLHHIKIFRGSLEKLPYVLLQNTPDPNPDIIGVGIRASIYILALSSHVCGFFNSLVKLSEAIDSSILVTAFAFVLTTAIITANESMDLFHALCLYWLISILVASSIRPMRLISAYKDARQAVQLVFFLLTLTGLMAYTTYRHATEPTFGNRAECNSHIIIACFGRGRPAVDSDRLVLLGLAATTSALEFIALCCFALSYVLLNCCGSGNHDEGTKQTIWVLD